MLHSQRVFVLRKPLHPKLNSEQSLHEVIAGIGKTVSPAEKVTVVFHGSEQITHTEMFFLLNS